MDNRAELAKDAKKADVEDVKKARALQALTKMEGWIFYQAALNNLIADKTKNIFEPTPADGRDAEQHNKGVVYGLIVARDLPNVIVGAMRELLDKQSSEPGEKS